MKTVERENTMVRKKFCLGEIGVTTSKQIRLSVCGQTVGKSHWTRRCLLTASIYSVNSLYPCAAMNFSLAISTRSHDSSPHGSTPMVPEKVHAVPFIRKF